MKQKTIEQFFIDEVIGIVEGQDVESLANGKFKFPQHIARSPFLLFKTTGDIQTDGYCSKYILLGELGDNEFEIIRGPLAWQTVNVGRNEDSIKYLEGEIVWWATKNLIEKNMIDISLRRKLV